MAASAWLRILSLGLSAVLLLSLPAVASTSEGRERRPSIAIEGDDEFVPANGVRSGSGTARDPYVISGWDVDRVHIRDTGAHFVFRDNLVRGTLRLNWNGPGVRVVNNDAWSLVVNENVRRTGDATSGVIARNRFGVVGQLRHFDGIFEHNLVDPRDDLWVSTFRTLPFTSSLSVAFDGFNGARFRHNEIHGPVRAQLHGHHHSSSFDEESHHHGSGHHGHDVDHSQRYHRVSITNNTIYSNQQYALMYTDINHAANDQTARSEENTALNGPHVHYTRVVMSENRLIGAGLAVNIFNADHPNHTGTQTGRVRIVGNDITVDEPRHPLASKLAGIDVRLGTDLEVHIDGNRITSTGVQNLAERIVNGSRHESGIRLENMRQAKIYLFDNHVIDARYGIEARSFRDVSWWIDAFVTTRVTEDLWYDNSSEPPRRGRP